jgi:hypothetical protein
LNTTSNGAIELYQNNKSIEFKTGAEWYWSYAFPILAQPFAKPLGFIRDDEVVWVITPKELIKLNLDHTK